MVENFDGGMYNHFFDNKVNKGYTLHHLSSPPFNFSEFAALFFAAYLEHEDKLQ